VQRATEKIVPTFRQDAEAQGEAGRRTDGRTVGQAADVDAPSTDATATCTTTATTTTTTM